MKVGMIAAAAAAMVAVVAAYGQPRAFKLPHTPIDAERMSHDVRKFTNAPEAERLDYLVRRFQQMGLKPGGERGGWFQSTPLVRASLDGAVTLDVTTQDGTTSLASGRDVALEATGAGERVQVERAPLVFVGHGLAGEAAVDDLTGKVALVLCPAHGPHAFDHQFTQPAQAEANDWRRAVDGAARRGAVAVLVIHQPSFAGDGWNRLASAYMRPQLALDDGKVQSGARLRGWMERTAAQRLFSTAGLDFDALAREADDPAFKPVALAGATLSADYRIRRERVVVRSLLAKLPGADTARDTVIYSARWRPLGGASDARGATPGASMDEATGLAALLELARVYSEGAPTRRTVVFAAFADDEHGRFGQEWYARRPIYPLDATVADIDIQALQTAGPAHDIVLAQAQSKPLDDDLARAAARQGRRVTYRRVTEWAPAAPALQARGVPVLPVTALNGGPDLINGGRPAGEAWLKGYLASHNRSHSSGDRWTPAWDLRGAALDVALLYEVGRDAANADLRPTGASASAGRNAAAR